MVGIGLRFDSFQTLLGATIISGTVKIFLDIYLPNQELNVFLGIALSVFFIIGALFFSIGFRDWRERHNQERDMESKEIKLKIIKLDGEIESINLNTSNDGRNKYLSEN
ncbi:hypothetical protein CMI38_02275 [Candidatus Pacearchaeota archaeon]|nr:hypothetical protein [Candidatus Pacearchaeota archaeon]|tara:strand:- start:473 stop:799 length:327 start_codon:yes stop_codon:yes gene_type:complete